MHGTNMNMGEISWSFLCQSFVSIRLSFNSTCVRCCVCPWNCLLFTGSSEGRYFPKILCHSNGKGWYLDWVTGWRVRGSRSDGGEILRTCPVRPRCPTSLLYNGYRVFPGGKAAGACRWPPIPN